MKMVNTTIAISDEIRCALERLKQHKKESYNDVLVRLTEKAEDKIQKGEID